MATPDSVADAVLGLCLRDPNALVSALSSGLSPAHFSRPEHQEAFSAILEADKAGRPFDAAALSVELPMATLWLVGLHERAPVGTNASYYAQQLVNRARRMGALQVLSELNHAVTNHDDREPLSSLEERLASGFTRLSSLGESPGGARDVRRVLDGVAENIEAAIQAHHDGRQTAISTGMARLDGALGGGWANKRLATICARSGKGKTTLALCLALHAALEGRKVAFFSVEADAVELGEKLVSNLSNVNGLKMTNGRITEEETRRVVAASEQIASTSFTFDDTFAGDIDVLESRLRRLKRQDRVDIAFVDYLQLLQDRAFKGAQRPQELATITGRIKRLAMELGIPIVALAQLNRLVDKSGERPTAADIADSSAIEKDSDVVMLLHWANDAGTERPQLTIAKNRRGVAGVTTQLHANLGVGRFWGE